MVEVCRSVTKHHYLVTDPRDLARIVRESLYIATTGRPGPVLIDLPKNVQLAQLVPDFDAPMQLPGYSGRSPQATEEELQAVVSVIKKARKPVIYAGGGVISANASDQLRRLSEKTGIPVTTTLTGLSAFPGDDARSLNMLGMHGTGYANYAVSECDLLLALGVRFDDRVTGKVAEFARHGTIVHIDIDPSEINKVKEAHLPIISDLHYALEQLNRIVEPPEHSLDPWHDRINKWKKEMPLSYKKDSDFILPQHAIEMLSDLTRDRETIISTGVGQHQMWAAQFYKFRHPKTWLSSCGLGTMGFGLPAAMGAKVANPEKLVIDIDGDGSFQMNIQEMGTCFCEEIPVKVLLLNNQHLGMVVQWEDRFHASNRAHTYLGPIHHPETVGKGVGISPEERYPDFVSIAKGYGWQGRTVAEKSELREALVEMIEAEGPYLLDVMVPYQEHVLPMTPPGGTVQDMIRE
jgi:acetolactate synthase-1/2/3 large subunit